MVDTAANIWRDDNGHRPVKSEIREWGTWVERALDQVITPDFFAEKTGVNDTAAILQARSAAVAGNAAIVLQSGTYFVDRTIELPSKTSLVIMPGAVLKAVAPFSGNSMVRLGNSSAGSFADDIYVGGGGVIDTANVANILFGIDVAYARFSKIENLKISGAVTNSIRVGDPSVAAASYEVDITGVRAWRNDVANVDGSHGIRWQNATDCYGSRIQAIGYRTGFLIDGASIELSQCHAWIRPAHGVMRRAFDIQGSGATLSQCYADTPTNVGNALIEDLACFNLYGFSPTLIGCRAFINTSYPGTDVSTDGLVSVINMEREVYATIDNLVLTGATGAKRWRALLSGTFGTGSTITNVIDGGATVYASATTREQRVSSLISTRINGPVIAGDVFETGGVYTANGKILGMDEVESRGAIRRRGAAGSNRDMYIQTDASQRWALRGSNAAESGSNTGTDFHLIAYSDAGSFLRTQMLMTRSSGLTRFGGPVAGQGYTFATLPDATQFNGAFIYVTDRSNRPAYSNGTNWKWVADDVTVS